MNSREKILQRLTQSLRSVEKPSLPPPHEVWPKTNLAPAMMLNRFSDELQEIHGEVLCCADLSHAARELAGLVGQAGWTKLGAMDRSILRQLAAAMPPAMLAWPDAAWSPRRIAELSAGLVAPELLIADTGSCLFVCSTTEERLLCYLPPACVVVAYASQLVEHLPAAWPNVMTRAADRSLRGELLIVTGPSRTTDIEKILILGVHGPKRLVVLIVEGE